MQLCVDYNNEKADTAQKCNAIAYDSDLTEAIGEKRKLRAMLLLADDMETDAKPRIEGQLLAEIFTRQILQS